MPTVEDVQRIITIAQIESGWECETNLPRLDGRPLSWTLRRGTEPGAREKIEVKIAKPARVIEMDQRSRDATNLDDLSYYECHEIDLESKESLDRLEARLQRARLKAAPSIGTAPSNIVAKLVDAVRGLTDAERKRFVDRLNGILCVRCGAMNPQCQCTYDG